MAIVTVTGAHGQISALSYDSALTTFVATQFANVINAGVAAGAIVPINDTDAVQPLNAGKTGEYVVTQSQTDFVPVGYDNVVVRGSGATVNLNADANQAILTGGSNVTLVGIGGAGSIVGGSGNISASLTNGNWTLVADNGSDTVSTGGSGHNTIQLDTGASSISLGGTSTNLVQTAGADTINVGAGAATVNTSSGGDLVHGGAGSLYFVGGTSSSTVIGGSGSETVFGGRGGGVFSGGTDGNNHLFGGVGAATLIGGGNGDVLTAQGGQAQTLTAGTGSETLMGSATGHDTFTFVSGNHGTDLVQNFVNNQDTVHLTGFGPNEVANALAGQVSTGTTTTITLSDNTRVTFQNIGHLTSSNFS